MLHTKKAESCANSVILRAVTAAASSWLLIDAIPANMMGYLMPSSWVSGVLSVDIALHLVGTSAEVSVAPERHLLLLHNLSHISKCKIGMRAAVGGAQSICDAAGILHAPRASLGNR